MSLNTSWKDCHTKSGSDERVRLGQSAVPVKVAEEGSLGGNEDVARTATVVGAATIHLRRGVQWQVGAIPGR